MTLNGDGLYEQVRNEDGRGWTYVFPDQLNFQKEPFATVIPLRSTTFKVHKTEGLANSALSHHKQGAKYRQENGVWVKVWEFYEPTTCENSECGRPLTDDDKRTDYYGYHKDWLRSPLHKGSNIFAPFLCRECYDAEKEIYDDRQRARLWRREQKNN